MAVFEVPLAAAPQTFAITLGGTSYQLTLIWREADGGGWFLDFATPHGAAILQGVPLVTGADLLAQYRHLGFTGSLVVQTDGDADAEPTYENLGSASHLYFLT
jgi:hypothetical protein